MRTRGFEIAKGFENENINLPTRATFKSAGYDIEAAETIEIKPGEIKLVRTGLKAYMLEDEVLKIFIRSSIATKKMAMMANNVGIIDADYYNNDSNDGHIMIPLYNFGNDILLVAKGDKIAQGIFEKYYLVDNDCPKQQNRVGGFGSSGNK